MFWKKRTKKWPKVDSCSEVQHFIDQMCLNSEVPHIKVSVKSKKRIEWFASLGATACAFAIPIDDQGIEFKRFIVFNGEACRISGKNRNVPIKVKHRHGSVPNIGTRKRSVSARPALLASHVGTRWVQEATEQ